MEWKGQTFNHIITKLKKNGTDPNSRTGIFSPPPVKHYRRELTSENNCSRATITMSDFEKPGANIVSHSGGNQHTIDITVPNIAAANNACVVCPNNARRRVRSTGNLFDIKDTNLAKNLNYNMTTKQYLTSRQQTYEKNNFETFFIDNPTFQDDKFATRPNNFIPGSFCKDGKYVINGFSTEEPLFQYMWVNGLVYDVFLPDGEYYLDDINRVFRNTMLSNKHYMIDKYSNYSYVFFMKFVYDVETKRIQIQSRGINSTLYPKSRYSVWTSYLVKVDWEIPEYTLVPCIFFNTPESRQLFGFEQDGPYPEEEINNTLLTQPATNTNPAENIFVNNPVYWVFGDHEPGIKPRHIPIQYKTNNPRFATNGSVSSSSLVLRKKYDTITVSQTVYTSGLGGRTSYALAYGISAPGYDIKYLLGDDKKRDVNCAITQTV